MTENEAIGILENVYEKYVRDCDNEDEYMKQNFAITEAIKSLSEIQQYRAIGTVEEFSEALENVKTLSGMYEKISDQEVDEYLKLSEYEEIGTVEECQEARERQRAKKPIKTPDCSDCEKECNQSCISFDCGKTYLCPTCHQNAVFNSEYDVFYKHCLNCGQKLDWTE